MVHVYIPGEREGRQGRERGREEGELRYVNYVVSHYYMYIYSLVNFFTVVGRPQKPRKLAPIQHMPAIRHIPICIVIHTHVPIKIYARRYMLIHIRASTMQTYVYVYPQVDVPLKGCGVEEHCLLLRDTLDLWLPRRQLGSLHQLSGTVPLFLCFKVSPDPLTGSSPASQHTNIVKPQKITISNT